jgi:quinol monooxygenase YgiN
MSKQISWRVVLVVKHGQINNFQALNEEMVESARKELGALIYERFVTNDGKLVEVYERYANSAAAVAHLQDFREKFGERFSSMVERTKFTVYGSPSDELRGLLDGFGAAYMRHFGNVAYWP